MIKTIFLNRTNRELVLDSIKTVYPEKELFRVKKTVQDIISQVKEEGDRGLLEITHRLEGNNLKPEELAVSKEEFAQAKEKIQPELLCIIQQAIERIEKFHLSQKENSWIAQQEKGIILGQLIQPLDRVGIYVPGGKADYPSSLIMAAVPALVAGVGEIIVTTPLGNKTEISPYVLATAQLLGISDIEEGIVIAQELIREFLTIKEIAGIHIFPMNKLSIIPKLIGNNFEEQLDFYSPNIFSRVDIN